MNSYNQTTTTTAEQQSFGIPPKDQIERLQAIIQAEGTRLSYQETEAIAYEMLSLYQCLSRGKAKLDGYQSEQ